MGYYYNYQYSTYIKGDFSKSYMYAKKVKKERPKYWVNSRNCMQMSIDTLLESSKKNFTMGQALTLHNLRGKVIPNLVRKPIAKLFGNSKY